MAKLPVDSRLLVEKQIEGKEVVQAFRKYLGISSLGKSCPRELWYSFRLCAERKISARLNRLFQRGHREEEIIQADLRSIGIVHHSDQKEVTFCHGHGKGHIDDILENVPDAPKTPHLGEYKTHNDKSFKSLLKDGMRKSKPVHYAQMICYMDLLGLKRGLYVAVNKNDDARYYERISADPDHAKKLFEKGTNIIRAIAPPERIGGPTWYECKWCDYYQICHFGDTILKTCRSCKHCKIQREGKWTCSKHKVWLSFEQQIKGCDDHQYLEVLVND